MLSLRSVYDSLSNSCLKLNLHFYCYVKEKNLNVSDSNHAISREPVRFIATMPSKMATQASWICEKKVDVQWKALGGKWVKKWKTSA